jgi:hypothetical protein
MKKVKLFMAMVMMASGINSYAQTVEKSSDAKLIAVVNVANWCGVCKANGARFGAVIMPYGEKGLKIYMNNITNDSTKSESRVLLENANVYETVYTIPRKGVGKALKACHMVKDKKQTQDVAGIVTFIDPVTHKQLKQVSISASDVEMNNIILKLLNK